MASIDPFCLELVPVDSGDLFLALLHEMTSDKSEFVSSAGRMIDTLGEGNLWTARIRGSVSKELEHLVCQDSFGNQVESVLPCLCWAHGSAATVIWVHSRARRKGIGRFLVKHLGIREAPVQLPGSEAFWAMVLGN